MTKFGGPLDGQNRPLNPLLAALALLVGTTLTIAFWPGVGTWEVIQFSLQRKLPMMNDWKPPFVAYIYWVSDDLFNSTGPVMLLQQALFWSGLALLSGNAFRHHGHQVLFFIAIAILPPIWVTEIMLWKEGWTLSFLMLGMGAAFAFLRSNRAFFAVISLIAGALITVTRQNTILLSFPSWYVIAQTMALKATFANKNQRRLIVISVIAILLGTTLGVNWALNQRGKQRCHIWHHTLLWDLAAISLFEKQMLIPEEFRRPGQTGSLAGIKKYFTYYNSDPLFFNNDSPLKLYGTAGTPCSEKLPLGILIKNWRKAILTYPGTYVRHRFLYIIHLLGIPDMSESWWGKKYYRIDSEYTAMANRSNLFELIRRNAIYEALVVARPMRGWLYMLIFLASVLGLPFKTSRTNAYLWCLWLAGCAYFASYAVIGSGSVMRYLVVYVVLGPAILAGRWMARTDNL